MTVNRNKEPWHIAHMGHFTDEEIQKMSMNQVYVLVCQGLAEVCYLMQQEPKYVAMNRRELDVMRHEFTNFAKVFAGLAKWEQNKQ